MMPARSWGVCVVMITTLIGLVPGLGGCKSRVLAEEPRSRSSSQVARLDVVIPPDCNSSAKMVTPPEQCVMPPAADQVIDASVELIVLVAPDGTPTDVRVTKSPGYDLDAAVAECARQGTYSNEKQSSQTPRDETCPLVFKLARYPTDLANPRSAYAQGCSGVAAGFPMPFETCHGR